MTLREFITEAEGSKEEVIAEAVKKLKVRQDSAVRMWRKVRGKSKPVEQAKSGGMSLDAFRERYDKSYIVPKKIDEQLNEMGASWMYESEFSKAAGVSIPDLSNFRDAYSDRIVYLKKENRRVWTGTAKLAEQLREMI